MNRYEERQEARRERLERAAERAARESSGAFKRAYAIHDQIPLGQPVLIGHHSEKRHRRALERADNAIRRGVEAEKRAHELRGRAASVGTAGVSSDDPDALDKLRERLDELRAKRDERKAIGAAWRKAGRPKSTDAIGWGKAAAILGVEPGALVKARADCASEEGFLNRGPVPSYVLTNLGGNIRRIEGRIRALEQQRERDATTLGGEDIETELGPGVTLTESPEENRLFLETRERLSAELVAILKVYGWRWARSRGCWSAYRNANARAAAERVGKELTP